MIRKGLKMKLKPGCEQEYKRRHDQIWEELSELLKETGISDYTIYLDPETLILFATMKVEDERALEKLPEQEIMKKWWDYMSDIMEVNPDNSPVTKELKEVFHLD